MTMQVNVHEKAAIVVLNCAFSWGTVTDKEITDENIKDKGAVAGSLRTRKTLLPQASGAHVDTLRSVCTTFYNRVHLQRTFSTPIKGQRVMPQAFYMDYMEAFGEAKAGARAALDSLVAGYPAAIEQAKDLLGSAFKADDYPPADELEHYLHMDVRFLPVPSGDKIMVALGAAVAADVEDYVGTILKTAADDAKTRLREAVAHMADRLTTKGAKMYDSMPETINELAEQLPAIAGLVGDAELEAMIKEVKQTLTGYKAEDFRASDALKTEVGRAASEVLKKMMGGGV